MRLHQRSNQLLVLALVAGLPTTTCAGIDPFAGLEAVGGGRLAQLRGGFEAPSGLQFSFAIERAVMINGELVSTTRLVLNDLMPLLTGGKPDVQLIGTVRDIVQSGLGNVVTVPNARIGAPATASPETVAVPPTAPLAPPVSTIAPAPVAAATGPATTGGAQTALGTPAATTSPSTAPAALATALPATVERQAAGQTLVLPNAAALVTTVQNTVNSQIIETRTTIDAVLSSVSALRASVLADAVRRTTLDGLRRP